MTKKIIKLISISAILILSISLFACAETTKKVTISNDTQTEILVEENEVKEAITTGKKLISDNKYDEAKAYFNKAISLDKSNKDLYLEIKDIYMESNKLDDAYFIIKSALTNNVDVENMKIVANEISSKFDVINLNYSIYQGLEYNLPESITTDIKDESLSLPIVWDVSQPDTTTAGTFTYYAFNEEYGRQVAMNLTVLENVYDKQIGYINKMYSSNGKLYIDVDLVEFYFGNKESLQEFINDNPDKYKVYLPINNNGEYYVPNGYYIRNNSDKITTYEVSSDSTFQLLNHDLIRLGYDPKPKENSSIPESVSLDTFKSYIDNSLDKERGSMCWIELKNGVAYSIYRQYTP